MRQNLCVTQDWPGSKTRPFGFKKDLHDDNARELSMRGVQTPAPEFPEMQLPLTYFWLQTSSPQPRTIPMQGADCPLQPKNVALTWASLGLYSCSTPLGPCLCVVVPPWGPARPRPFGAACALLSLQAARWGARPHSGHGGCSARHVLGHEQWPLPQSGWPSLASSGAPVYGIHPSCSALSHWMREGLQPRYCSEPLLQRAPRSCLVMSWPAEGNRKRYARFHLEAILVSMVVSGLYNTCPICQRNC